MQPLLSVWSAFNPRQRMIVTLASAAMFIAVLALSRLAGTPNMTLLYSGLQGTAAGEIVKALDQQGVAYDVRGDSIWVDASRRDALRMTLAADGLPANGGAGYELLDNLSGFGTTSQMFDAAYWRATEGELARSIVTNPQIRAARVYISAGQSQPFRREVKPTASVMVTTASGGLPSAQVKALKYLVASAVADLKPEDVAVIDSVGGLLGGSGDGPGADQTAGDRAERIKRNVQALMDARVGPGKSVVAVHVETVHERESIVERRFDPNGRVAISTVTQENSQTSKDSGGAPVTVASNLPNGDAGAAGSSSDNQRTENRSQTNYEVSSTQRQVERKPGAIKKLSVAVMVDGLKSVGADGKTTWQPRPEAELTALRELVASAVGFDEKRGDQITIRSLAFEPPPDAGTSATTSWLSNIRFDATSAVQMALVAMVIVVLALFVFRPLIAAVKTTQRPALAGPAPAGEGADAIADAASGATAGAVTGAQPAGTHLLGTSQPESESASDAFSDDDMDLNSMGLGGNMNIVSLDALGEPMGDGGDSDDPVERLRRLIEERQEETLEILRSWVEDRKETSP